MGGSFAAIFSSKHNLISSNFQQETEEWRRNGITAWFVPWNEVRDLKEAAQSLHDVKRILRLPDSADVTSWPEKNDTLSTRGQLDIPRTLDRKDARLISKYLSLATNSFRTPGDFFDSLLFDLDLPSDWESEYKALLTGNPDLDAERVVKFAYGKGGYPPDHGQVGSSVLGAIMERLIKERVDTNMRLRLAVIALKYELLNQEGIDKLQPPSSS
jgi:hypothetical protein